MKELLKEAFHTYKIYLSISGILDSNTKMALLKWPDAVHSAIELVDALENNKDGTHIKQVLIKDLEVALLEPIKRIFQSVIIRSIETCGDKIDSELLEATKNDPKVNPIELKNIYIYRINKLFKILEDNTSDKYPKIRTQSETPVKIKEL